MEVDIDYGSMRAVKARFAASFQGMWYRVAYVVAFLFLGAGVLGLLIGQSVGWLIVGLATVPIMLIEWYNGELKEIPVGPSMQIITDTLDGVVLGQLPKNPTALDIATAIGTTYEVQFLGARLGVTARLLQDIAEHAKPRPDTIWNAAFEIREQLGQVQLSPDIVALALLRQYPDYESLIAKIHLTDSDIYKGIEWRLHLADLIQKDSAPKRTGGVARDWSFGYIPMLSRFGQNISNQVSRGGIIHVKLEAHEKALSQMFEAFSSGGAQNATLIGEPGVGKTTLVHAFAQLLLDAKASIPLSLRFMQVFSLDATSLISAAPGRGELEYLLMQILGEAYSAKNIIIYIDNAELFFEEGVGSVNIANTIIPVLEAGNLRIILSMDRQRLLKIAQQLPALANVLNRIIVQPASQSETMMVMQDQLISTEFRRHVTYTYQALTEAYRLSQRYVHDIAMPGRAVKLMEASAAYSEHGLVTMNSVQQAIEETMDVKVSVASEADEREKLLHLEEHIHKRMVNQVRAVEVVSDALRRARSGVRNQDRPIGTFLFLGPTGVGKTELAKALADVYFGGEDRIIRLDLNEYVQNEDVSRLIADGSSDASSLTAQVLKQPFSVVLFDEIEKAHPNVLTTLLQLLDEGILRDERSREVSFRDAIIIATSNAGADRIRELVARGQKPAQFEDQFMDELIASGQFKPEFINRFDEVVVFTPLSKNDLLRVVDLMIDEINRTLAVQHIEVEVEQAARLLLVERGYDPRLGARPMRRVIQKAVENIVAKAMLSGEATAGSVITITFESAEAMLGSAVQAEQIAADNAI